MKISVVIPCFNEAPTLERLVEAVLASGIENLEVVLVDDASDDGSRELIDAVLRRRVHCALRHERNRGKGAALRTGFASATGDVVLVQDADLEYDPRDYPRLLEPILAGEADVVFGSRFAEDGAEPVPRSWHAAANRAMTRLSNALNHLDLTDMESGYKVFRREVLARLELSEDGFGFEPEVTAKVARLGVRVREVAISYAGRTRAEGKKLRWRDGLHAVWCVVKYNLERSRAGPSLSPASARR